MKALLLRMWATILSLEAYYFLIPPAISVSAVVFLFLATGCASTQPATLNLCIPLRAPPTTVVDALEEAGRKDPSAASWVIDLDRHYQKLDVCRKVR